MLWTIATSNPIGFPANKYIQVILHSNPKDTQVHRQMCMDKRDMHVHSDVRGPLASLGLSLDKNSDVDPNRAGTPER